MDLKRYAPIVLLLAMSLCGFMAVCGRNLSAAGLSHFDVTFLRLFISTAVLFVFMILLSRQRLVINKKDALYLILFGVFKFLSDYTFFRSADTISMSLTSLLQNTAPYFVMIVSYFLFKERVSRKTILAMMIGTFGCVLMSGSALFRANIDPMGLVFAVLSGFFLGMYFIGSRISSDKGYDAMTYLFYVMLIATIASLPFTDPGRIVESMSDSNVVLNALALGILITLIPYYVIAWSVKYVGQLKASVIAVSEVVFAAMCGAIFFDEALDILDVFGIVMMIISIISISAMSVKNGNRKESDESAD